MEIKKIAKYIWRGACVVLALTVLVVLSILGYFWGSEKCHWWGKNYGYYYSKQLGKNARYLSDYDFLWERSYIGVVVDAKGRKLLNDVQWVMKADEDSIAVFAQKGFRGYINANTGKVLVPATKYIEAYVFSEGRAVALTRDSIYVLDNEGHEVGHGFARYADKKRITNQFRNGYLPMVGADGRLGFINADAEWCVDPTYDEIIRLGSNLWLARMGQNDSNVRHCIVIDASLNVRMEGMWSRVEAAGNGIVVAGADNWQRRYSLDGDLLEDFVCADVRLMTYSTGETQLVTLQSKGEYDDGITITTEEREIKGVASLKKYIVSSGYEGLMTQDCVPLTPPLYWNITAISKDRFYCNFGKCSSAGVVLDEKGRVVYTRN